MKPHQTLMAAITVVVITTLFFASYANADVNLVLPVYTKHVQYGEKVDYVENFDNTALGLEYSNEKYAFGLTRVFKNSYSKQSWYAHAVRYTAQPGFKVGLGVIAVHGGYDKPLYAVPLIAFKYKYIQVVTSIPFGRATGQQADLINAQLVIPFGG